MLQYSSNLGKGGNTENLGIMLFKPVYQLSDEQEWGVKCRGRRHMSWKLYPSRGLFLTAYP